MFTRPLEQWRPTASDDGSGGQVETYSRVGTSTLLCKVDQPSAKDQVVAAQNSALLMHSIYADGVVDIRRGDQLRDPAPPADVYTVVSVVRPSTPIYTKALCETEQYEES